jgi:hypothetical protein
VPALLQGFAAVRPILETGWEAVLMTHLLAQGTSPDEVIAAFHARLKGSWMCVCVCVTGTVSCAAMYMRVCVGVQGSFWPSTAWGWRT